MKKQEQQTERQLKELLCQQGHLKEHLVTSVLIRTRSAHTQTHTPTHTLYRAEDIKDSLLQREKKVIFHPQSTIVLRLNYLLKVFILLLHCNEVHVR